MSDRDVRFVEGVGDSGSREALVHLVHSVEL